MSEFRYPKLNRADIISVLTGAQIAAVSENELRNPNPAFVSELYTRILIYIDALDEEDKGQVDFAALEQFENPDHFVGAVPTFNLYSKVKEMLDLVDCPHKFSLKDLIRPDGPRTEFFIGALLNYCLHRESKLELMKPIWDELALLDERQKEWEAKISQLNSEIADINEARESELPLVQEVEAKVKELQQTIAGLNSQQVSLKAAFRKLKEKAADKDKEISKAEFDLVQTVQESANLRSKIVQSPDKLQRALEEKKSIREETNNAERSAMQAFQERAATLDVYAKVFKKLSKSAAQMQSINKQVISAKSIEKDFKVLKAKLSDDGVMDKSLEAKLVEKQGTVEQLHETLKQLEKERELLFEETNKELNTVKMEVESKRRDLEARQKEVESVVAKVDANTTKTEQVKQSGEAQVQQLVLKCEEIVKQNSNSLQNSFPNKFQEYTNSFGTLLRFD